MNKDIKHIFFDLDHTLWDFDKNSGLTFQKIFDLHEINVGLNDFLEVYEPINFKYWKLFREEKVNKPKLRYGRLKDAFDAIDFFVEDNLIDQLSEDYITYLTTFNNVFEGTYDILDYLESKYDLHIITNGFEEAQSKKIEKANLQSYFKTVTNSEMAGVKKPNPKIFNHALKLANADPENSIMIGDNIEADVQGAIDVGMQAVLFDYANRNISSNYKTINKLKQLREFL